MSNKKVTKLDKSAALESALYKLRDEQNFYGGLLQELNIHFSTMVPTACIAYNKKKDIIEVHLAEEYFCSKPIQERTSLLFHEVLHFCHQHLWRFMAQMKDKKDQPIFNIAADMSINQYIQGLPKGSVSVAQFKNKDGTPFAQFQTMEYYWELLEKLDGNDAKDKANKNGEKTPNQDEIEKYLGNPLDEHRFGDADGGELSEEEMQKMLSEAKKVIKRTIEKSQFGHSNVPDSIKDLLEKIDIQLQGINYKQILRSIIKRTICSNDRDHTWNKPSKRFGVYAKGTTIAKIPNLLFLVDTSGSISHTEMTEFFKVVDGFLNLGQKTCKVGFWHTDLYKIKKYKTYKDISADDVQSGGTNVTPALEYAKLVHADLTIILTDGYFDRQKNFKFENNLLWCISKNGNKNHPFSDVGKTIQIK